MKKITFWVILLCLLTLGTSCKPKQSAYKRAYEQAKERDIEPVFDIENQDIPPVMKSITPESSAPRQEVINPVAGENGTGIKLYSVVIGSFENRTNAYSLKERMQNEGYMPILGENPQGMLRVILTSHENRQDAEHSREAIRRKYYPNFQDAWLLERRY
ncbi:MAG: SPOR domain-containing protein [Tannerella sp.]|jgi:cell division septation protein DedD|nr:SPOR domain-containing protein [Tannerella sp.]